MKTLQEFLIESDKNRTSMVEFEKILYKFLPFVFKELKINSIPSLHFRNGKGGLHIKDIPGITVVKNSGFSQVKGTFGQTSHKNRIVINIKNRHPLDALRTVAHELTHYAQHINGIMGTGEIGSSTENNANIKSGIIMRNFDHAYPNLFELNPL